MSQNHQSLALFIIYIYILQKIFRYDWRRYSQFFFFLSEISFIWKFFFYIRSMILLCDAHQLQSLRSRTVYPFVRKFRKFVARYATIPIRKTFTLNSDLTVRSMELSISFLRVYIIHNCITFINTGSRPLLIKNRQKTWKKMKPNSK